MRDLLKAQLVGNAIVYAALGVALGLANVLHGHAAQVRGLPSTGAGGFLAGLLSAAVCFVFFGALACLALAVGLRVRRRTGRPASGGGGGGEAPARQAAV